jgi:hypothetical protein
VTVIGKRAAIVSAAPTASTRHLLTAGFVPLPWFLFWTTAGGLLAPHYHPLAQQASELGLVGGLPNLMLAIAAIGSGLAFVAFGAGLWLETGRRVTFGAGAWAVFGVAMISNGVWRMGGPLHGLYGIGIINVIAPGLACAECERLSGNRFVLRATVVVSLASIFYLWLNLAGYDPWALRGLTQRVFSTVNSGWPAAVAYALIRGAAGAAGDRFGYLKADRVQGSLSGP